MLTELKGIMEDSDMVLIGLGEEFNDISFLKKHTDYEQGRTRLEENGFLWLLPAYEQNCREKMPNRQEEIKEALNNLAEFVKEKNYFVVSTAVNVMIREISWKQDRLVMPCGGVRQKQCSCVCEGTLQYVTAQEHQNLSSYLEKADFSAEWENILGKCPKCGKPYILNNIYAEQYDESGYLPQWQLYTKWLQGTLNRKVLILELGVGMRFPSVIRWPFEKIAYFNQKASFFRVNEHLYQMSEELKEKGVSIARNSVVWLRGM